MEEEKLSSSMIYKFKVKDYTTVLIGRYDNEREEFYIQRGDGEKYRYSNHSEGGRIEWHEPLCEFDRQDEELNLAIGFHKWMDLNDWKTTSWNEKKYLQQDTQKTVDSIEKLYEEFLKDINVNTMYLSVIPKVKSENDKWIDAKIRLPKPITLAIIWTTISIEPTLGFYVNDWLYFSTNDNFWIKDQPHIEVLYWQPLPKIPDQILNKIKNETE